jgi:small subunit ribosomal protein S20
MANNKSALKRIKINERNRTRNKSYKLELKRALKTYLLAVEQHRLEPTSDTFDQVKYNLSTTYQKFDKCVKVNVLHPNTAARKKAKVAQLMRMVNSTEINNLELPSIKSPIT